MTDARPTPVRGLSCPADRPARRGGGARPAPRPAGLGPAGAGRRWPRSSAGGRLGRILVGMVAGRAGRRVRGAGRRPRPRADGAGPRTARRGRVRARAGAHRGSVERHGRRPARSMRRRTTPTPPTWICSATGRSSSCCRPRGCTPASRRWPTGCWRRPTRRPSPPVRRAMDDLRGDVDLREQLALTGDSVSAWLDTAGLASWGVQPPLLTGVWPRAVGGSRLAAGQHRCAGRRLCLRRQPGLGRRSASPAR